MPIFSFLSLRPMSQTPTRTPEFLYPDPVSFPVKAARKVSEAVVNAAYPLIDWSLTFAERNRLIDSYLIDSAGDMNTAVIEAFAPKYDDPASGLPFWAAWKNDNHGHRDRYLKVGVFIIVVSFNLTHKHDSHYHS